MIAVGQTFAHFTVVSLRTHNLGAAWRVRCVCGVERVYQANELLKGKRKSCGCRKVGLG